MSGCVPVFVESRWLAHSHFCEAHACTILQSVSGKRDHVSFVYFFGIVRFCTVIDVSVWGLFFGLFTHMHACI